MKKRILKLSAQMRENIMLDFFASILELNAIKKIHRIFYGRNFDGIKKVFLSLNFVAMTYLVIYVDNSTN